jgi:hypothetical protein
MDNRSRFIALLLFLAAILAASTGGLAQAPSVGVSPGEAIDESLPATDPIAAVGYGQLFDAEGNVIPPTRDFRQRALNYYHNRLMGEAPRSLRIRYQEVKKLLDDKGKELGIDDVLAQSLLIDWLIDNLHPNDAAYLKAKNRTLRLGHVTANAGSRASWRSPDHQYGLPSEILDFTFGSHILTKTLATGREYISECREAGVPIPPTWGTPSWVYEGDLTTNFVGSGNPARIFSAESTNPNGICVALPRIGGNTISLLGIICLGRQTNHVCFWDRANTPVGTEVPIEDFQGGAALGDICSDCHAGENPFVVHPYSSKDPNSPFKKLASRLRTTAWYTPHVQPAWPQNPGPSILPEIVPLPSASDQRCTSCHDQSYAGRFPEVGALKGYCTTVLKKAIQQTMPLGNPGDPMYAAHADAMQAFCTQKPPGGSEVPKGDVKDNPQFVSSPIVVGPLYGCTEAIEIRGAVRHAQLTVFINGTSLPPVTALDPDKQLVPVPALVPGQKVVATQTVDGLESDKSNEETVRDHTVDFPMGLPKPEIFPPVIYECGNVIAVRHLRGAKVTVYTNGKDPVTFSTGGDWTNVQPAGAPFSFKDKFKARYQMCSTDVPSPESNEESAVTAPTTMPTPALDPPKTFQGQELVTVTNLLNGAMTEVTDGAGAGPARFSTAIDRMPNVDIATAFGQPLTGSQGLIVHSKLCTAAPRLVIEGARPCTELPAPAIQQPFVGQKVVFVTKSVPGARIFVYDKALDEIGDGSGGIVPLKRVIVSGDILTVLQKIGECTSANAYQVEALCASTKQGC